MNSITGLMRARAAILKKNGREEIFEIIVSAQGSPQSVFYNKYDFGETLISLIDLDISACYKNVIDRAKEFKCIQDSNLNRITQSVSEIVQCSHPYFCVLIQQLCACEGKHAVDSVINDFFEQLKVIQQDAISLVSTVLNPGNILSDFTTAEAFRDFRFLVPDCEVRTTVELVSKDMSDDLGREKGQNLMLANASYPETVFDLYRFFRNEYILHYLKVKPCKNCGRFFITKDYLGIEYCNRLSPGSTLTCRVIGPTRIYQNKQKMNPITKEYTRAYRTHNARIRYGLMTKEEFKRWSVEARQKRDLCIAGKLSLEDFVAWLDSDKQR